MGPCFATSYPDAYRRNHCPIDGKSTLHRRKIHAPSTENPRSIDGKSTLHRRRLSYTGSTPLLYPPKRLASPTPHSHHRHRLPNFLLFFFSLSFFPSSLPTSLASFLRAPLACS